jgi:hypothetical protein
VNRKIKRLKVNVEFLVESLRHRGLDFDSVIPRLHAVIYPRYEAWAEFHSQLDLALGIESGTRDLASYLLEHAIPASLLRSFPPSVLRSEFGELKITDGYEQIREVEAIAREFDADEFFGILMIYAARNGDARALERAWDALTNRLHPCLVVIERFKNAQKGGLAERGMSVAPKAQKILAIAQRLLRSGTSRISWASIIASELDVTRQYVRRVLKIYETVLSKRFP